MNRSIRSKFFFWVGLQTLIVFVAIGCVLLVFNLHERDEHPDMVAEEAEELLVVIAAMAAVFPLALGCAWWVSRRLLRPWQDLVAQAERIRDGRLEERIAAANPEDEIGRLAAILNSTFDRYRQVMDRLHRFSYDASHQLRNPLASIRMSGEVCLRSPREASEYEATIGGMLEDAARLSRTVEQLLMLARAAGADLTDQTGEVDLAGIAEDVAAEARAVGESRGIEVVCEVPAVRARVRGLNELLREALANLVDNALRFSPDGGRIDIVLTCAANGDVRVEVADRGPGVPLELRAELFRPFRKASATEGGRTGLGLAIVADICRAHRGSVGVTERFGGGSVFWMEFPARGV